MEYNPLNDPTYLSKQQLSVELLNSIRDIECRLSEIKILLGTGPYPGQPERRTYVIERYQRLIETRFCLVYSFMDLNPSFNKDIESLNPFEHFNIGYELFKRNI